MWVFQGKQLLEYLLLSTALYSGLAAELVPKMPVLLTVLYIICYMKIKYL